MTRQKSRSAYTLADVELLETMFDVGERDHVVHLIKGAFDPQIEGHRADLADALDKYLLPHVSRFIEKLYEQGRGRQAYEFGAAIALRDTVDDVTKTLRRSDDGAMDLPTAGKLATDLENAWTRLIADGSAHRMAQLATEISDQTNRNMKANANRKADADDRILNEFAKWQHGAASQLRDLTEAERVEKFKIAKRPLPDRALRRISRLLAERKIPLLQK